MSLTIDGLVGLINDNHCETIVEIGVYRGRFGRLFAGHAQRFMDKYSQQFRSMDENTINSNISEGQKLLVKLVTDLETSMVVNREEDQTSVRMYLDDNIKGLIDQSLRDVR